MRNKEKQKVLVKKERAEQVMNSGAEGAGPMVTIRKKQMYFLAIADCISCPDFFFWIVFLVS